MKLRYTEESLVTVVAPTIKPQFTVFVEGQNLNERFSDLFIIKQLCPNILVQAAGSKSVLVDKVKKIMYLHC